MTIDGTHISTFGMVVSSVSDYFNQPARKKILSDVGFEGKDIKHEAKEAVVTLWGLYTTKAELFEKVYDLKTLLASNVSHDYILIGHSISFTGVITEGVKVEVAKTKATITLKITIV